ncbi:MULTISPECIES: oxygenase MpaB family protein [unclassified Nocardia]|uniref:oxygenase MpaB family protein n=1 Tax=unclassified Nocardia TaxID=2637762 RepID=UPI001CE40C1A|nr:MULTISPECIES: oxygenase MpaB family protein [unclassified Nocardia]
MPPPLDYGFFGPDSVARRVWLYPTAALSGFSRAVVIEQLDPFLVAAVDHTQKIYRDTPARYNHTMAYFSTVIFGDSVTAVKSSEMLVKIHAKHGVGIEPLSGLPYDANNPDSQLWILLTAWHSILYTYELLGPGRLSEEDERRYWAECAIAAQLQTCDPEKVPRSREGIRAYFDEVRPQLCASEATQRAMAHLLEPRHIYPPLPLILRPTGWLLNKIWRAATLSTIPQWQRELAAQDQSRLVDALIRPIAKGVYRLLSLSDRVALALATWVAPSAGPILAPVLRHVPPQHAEVVTPAEAFARHGVPTPAEVRAGLQAGVIPHVTIGD